MKFWHVAQYLHHISNFHLIYVENTLNKYGPLAINFMDIDPVNTGTMSIFF